MRQPLSLFWHFLLPAVMLVSAGIAGIFIFLHQASLAHELLFWTLVFGCIPLCYHILSGFSKKSLGIDIIALIAIVSCFLLQEYLVGIVILLMLATGEALEFLAFQQARRGIAELIDKAPTKAHKKQDGQLLEVPVETIVPGDIIIVKPGEMIPVDGRVVAGHSFVDEASLTGESLPLEKYLGSIVMSGSINQSEVLEIEAHSSSAESKYERIIHLVREAESQKAPFVRLADRYSLFFTLITFIFASLAWFFSNDPTRVLAVLVVATPCPLILATPIAFASGISQAARRGIMIKHGGAIETLAKARAFVFDKTGTLTLGIPSITLVESHSHHTRENILQIAASLEQVSAHILGQSLVNHAKQKQIKLDYPENFEEVFGKGIHGNINGTNYFFGSLNFLISHNITVPKTVLEKHEALRNLGSITAYLADDRNLLGDIHFSDTVRNEVKTLFQNLKTNGIQKLIMLTGDKKHVAQAIAQRAGITEYRAECLPEDKLSEVNKLKKDISPVVMIGDGINDAPALVAADMGIAMGIHGATASSEAGDIVITVNTLERVGEALEISRRVLLVAQQGIFIGIGLSITLMIFASFGFIQPVLGAVLQEAIDVIAILNALRVRLPTTKETNV